MPSKPPATLPPDLKNAVRQYNPILARELELWLKLCKRVRVALDNSLDQQKGRKRSEKTPPPKEWVDAFRAGLYGAKELMRLAIDLEKSRDASKLTEAELRVELEMTMEHWIRRLPIEKRKKIMEGYGYVSEAGTA